MTHSSLSERVYTPDADRQRGLSVWRDMIADVRDNRELIVRLAHRDLTVGYRQSMLGLVWAVIVPLLTVALFAYLASTRLVPIGETRLPYPLYALWGVVLWQLFASILATATTSLANAGSLVTKIDFPKEAIVFASLGRPLVEFAAKLVLVAAMLLYYDAAFTASMFWLLPIVLLVVLMALGAGMLFSLANLVVRDIANLVGIMATFGMFLAPVLYPPAIQAPLAYLVVLNPFSPLVMASHDLLSGSGVVHAELLLFSGLVSVFCFLFAWRVFRVTIRRIAERA